MVLEVQGGRVRMRLLPGSPKALQGLTWTETGNMHLCALSGLSLLFSSLWYSIMGPSSPPQRSVSKHQPGRMTPLSGICLDDLVLIFWRQGLRGWSQTHSNPLAVVFKLQAKRSTLWYVKIQIKLQQMNHE